jgi:ABC-type transporter Mla subunit MlaD
MNVKVLVAILTAVVLVYAQTQSSSALQVNKGDAQKVVTIISGDKAKTQTYCDMKKLAEQIEEASAKKDAQTVNELSQKVEALEKTLGPEYAALLDGFEDIAKDDQLGEEFESAVAALDRLCTR